MTAIAWTSDGTYEFSKGTSSDWNNQNVLTSSASGRQMVTNTSGFASQVTVGGNWTFYFAFKSLVDDADVDLVKYILAANKSTGEYLRLYIYRKYNSGTSKYYNMLTVRQYDGIVSARVGDYELEDIDSQWAHDNRAAKCFYSITNDGTNVKVYCNHKNNVLSLSSPNSGITPVTLDSTTFFGNYTTAFTGNLPAEYGDWYFAPQTHTAEQIQDMFDWYGRKYGAVDDNQ